MPPEQAAPTRPHTVGPHPASVQQRATRKLLRANYFALGVRSVVVQEAMAMVLSRRNIMFVRLLAS